MGGVILPFALGQWGMVLAVVIGLASTGEFDWGVAGTVFGKAVGFNTRGAWRIGFGMLPRGEVALIVAGTGLAAGIITPTIFGVSILMTMVTTLIAPIALVPLFESGGSGRRGDTAAVDAS